MVVYSVSFLISSQTVHLLLKYGSDPYQMNDQELTPIDVCKNEEIVRVMKDWSGHRHAHEDSEDEDVFTLSKERLRVSCSHLRAGSKGSSHSSVGEEEADVCNGKGTTPDTITTKSGTGRGVVYTPTSRPREAFYDGLSLMEGDGDNNSKPAEGLKRRCLLAKMGEAKQKLLGKLEESGDVGKMMRKLEGEEPSGQDGGEDNDSSGEGKYTGARGQKSVRDEERECSNNGIYITMSAAHMSLLHYKMDINWWMCYPINDASINNIMSEHNFFQLCRACIHV